MFKNPKLRSRRLKASWTEERRKAWSVYQKKKWTKSKRKKWGKKQKALWKNKKIRKKRLAGLKRDSTKRKRRKSMKEVFKRPEWRAERSRVANERWADEKNKEKQSRVMKRYWRDPEWRKENLPKIIKVAKASKTRKFNSIAMKKDWENRSEERLKAIVEGAIRAGNKKAYGTKPELFLRKALWNSGLRFKTHCCMVCSNGQRCVPDVVFTKKKVVVFCDGVYWHAPVKVKEKDERVNVALKKDGWKVLRFSDLKILKNIVTVVRKIREVVDG